MEELRIVFGKVLKFPGNDYSEYGIDIVFNNAEPVGMRYWNDEDTVCGFCGSLETMCTHGSLIDSGIMSSWDVRCLLRRILSMNYIKPSEKKWWKFNDEAKAIVVKWMEENGLLLSALQNV